MRVINRHCLAVNCDKLKKKKRERKREDKNNVFVSDLLFIQPFFTSCTLYFTLFSTLNFLHLSPVSHPHSYFLCLSMLPFAVCSWPEIAHGHKSSVIKSQEHAGFYSAKFLCSFIHVREELIKRNQLFGCEFGPKTCVRLSFNGVMSENNCFMCPPHPGLWP